MPRVGAIAKRRKRRTYNVRLVRRTLSYEIREIADLFGLHPQAVRRWLPRGLSPIDHRRPMLFRGIEIIRFLTEEQTVRKVRVPPGLIYCCGCRAPRRPADGIVKVRRTSRTKIILVGTCPTCGSRLNRFGAAGRLDDYRNHFVLRAAAPAHLTGRTDAADKCHKTKETEDA